MTVPTITAGPSVNGADLLDEVRAVLTRYVVLPSGSAADAVTLWIAATHGVNCWQHATRLVIKSPEKRCGKSRLLDVIEGTCSRPLMTVNATVAAIFRSIGDTDQPTLLLDEADTVFGTKMMAESNEDLRGLLNAGFGRGRPTLRTVGPQHTVAEFPTFAMAALAGIGSLPDTIEDRAVIVTMRRRAAGEAVQQFRQRKDQPVLNEIRARLNDWVSSVGDDLADAEPDNPLADRAADVWEPLLAVADAAGGRWPAAARSAALVMSADSDEADGERSLGTRLLADIKELFDSFTVSFMTSAVMVDRLRHMDDAPWRDIDLTTRRLSDRLRPYGIKPGHNPAGTERGYQLAKFADAFARYLADNPSEPVRSSEAPENKAEALTGSIRLTDRSVRSSESVRSEPNESVPSNGLTPPDVGSPEEPDTRPSNDLYAIWDRKVATEKSEAVRPSAAKPPGNPICRDCGKPNLFAPASIARGICASCVKAAEAIA